jgi:hypothetical protein
MPELLRRSGNRNEEVDPGVLVSAFKDLSAVTSMAANGYEAVKNGSVVLRYGAALPDTKEEPGDAVSDEVLAYQKQVPESGGKVLMLDRRVKTMSAEEFKSARKAGK